MKIQRSTDLPTEAPIFKQCWIIKWSLCYPWHWCEINHKPEVWDQKLKHIWIIQYLVELRKTMQSIYFINHMYLPTYLQRKIEVTNKVHLYLTKSQDELATKPKWNKYKLAILWCIQTLSNERQTIPSTSGNPVLVTSSERNDRVESSLTKCSHLLKSIQYLI
jgi:hypothetical protein